MENTKTAEEIAHQIVLAQLGGPKHIIEISVEALELYAAPLKKRIEELEAHLRLSKTQIEFLVNEYCQGHSVSSADTIKRINELLNSSTNGK